MFVIRLFLLTTLALLCIEWSYAISVSPSILNHAVGEFMLLVTYTAPSNYTNACAFEIHHLKICMHC